MSYQEKAVSYDSPMMAPFQVIDAFFGCTLTPTDIDFLDQLPLEEMMDMAGAAAFSLRLVPDGIGNWYPDGRVPYRDLTMVIKPEEAL